MTNIYVGNLSYRATEDELRQAFGQFGQVSAVNIISDRETGRSRGFAFVEMPNAEEAKAAVEGLDQKEISGRRVTVNEARPREERPRGGGRGYGGDREDRAYGSGGGYGGGYGGDRDRNDRDRGDRGDRERGDRGDRRSSRY